MKYSLAFFNSAQRRLRLDMKSWNELELKIGQLVIFINGYKGGTLKYGKVVKICDVKVTLEANIWGDQISKVSVRPDKIYIPHELGKEPKIWTKEKNNGND